MVAKTNKVANSTAPMRNTRPELIKASSNSQSSLQRQGYRDTNLVPILQDLRAVCVMFDGVSTASLQGSD